MPLPPRQPYAFASSNPSAASSSQNQFNNHYQQLQRPPANTPRRGYTAAPGAASAVSLLPPGQRDGSSDSVVRISNRSTRSPQPPAHIAPSLLQHSNPFNTLSLSAAHTISDKVRNMLQVDIDSVAHTLPGRNAPLDAQGQDNHPRCHVRHPRRIS